MFFWLIFLGGAELAAAVPLVYSPGLLHPIVDTGGTFSTNTDPDSGDQTVDLSTSLGPT
jgi:hypothetical protein